MKKGLLLAAAAAFLVGSYISYPYYSVNRLSDAVRLDNPAQLDAMVDWPSVRQGLEADLNALLAGTVAQTAGDGPGHALGQIVLKVMGPKVIEKAVEAYSTPAGFAELIRSGGRIDVRAAAARTVAAMAGASATQPQDAAAADPVAGTENGIPLPPREEFSIKVKSLGFVGVNAMEVEFETPDRNEKAPVRGIMKLEGAKWKVTRLLLPVDDMLDAPQTAARPNK